VGRGNGSGLRGATAPRGPELCAVGDRTGRTARLAVEDDLLVGRGRRGVRVELSAARTLWIFRSQGRDGLAVLDRHGTGLLVLDATFDPHRVRAFATRHGLAFWLGALSEAEPGYRLAGARRLRGLPGRAALRTLRRGARRAVATVRRWAAEHGFTTAIART
jgi:hypothetical protein